MDLIKTLRRAFLFEALSAQQIEQLASFTTTKTLQKDEHLFLEGDRASAFFFIVSGRVKIYRISSEGQEHILEIHGTGDLIAEAAIFDKETYPAFCQALDETVLLRIPKDDFIALVRKYPEIGIAVMHGYSKRLRFLLNKVEDLSMFDIKSRLAKYLINRLETEDDQLICRIPVTKRELASLLDTIPETLSRTLTALKKEGVIKEEGDLIIVLDYKALMRLI
jgi:CRP/FNR family transcriptional regulator